MKRLVFATNNQHKLEEAREILGGEVELVSLSDIGCHEDIPETAPTLEGNAFQKARYIHEHYGVACVADDTGLMVDALGGAPGVYSARYAGPEHDSRANMKKLLAEMSDKDDRRAHFSTMLAYVSDKEERVFEGRVDGSIAREPSGDSGFGYDPVFVVEDTGRTFAEMSADEKNAVSHRGRAFRKFSEWFAALTLLLLCLCGVNPARAEQWIQHQSYDGATYCILDAPAGTYFLTLKQQYNPDVTGGTNRFGSVYKYDKNAEEWSWLTRADGLSEMIVVAAVYDYTNRVLALGYDNGNIDLVYDNGRVVNVPGLKMADNVSTNIREMNIDPAGGDLWVSTATGYVRVNTKRGEVVTSRDYQQGINSAAKYDGYLFLATDDGLCYGDERTSAISSYTRVPDTAGIGRLFAWDGRLWTVSAKGNRLGVISGKAGDYAPQWFSTGDEYSVQPGRDGILVSGPDGIRWIAPGLKVTAWAKPSNTQNPIAGSIDGRAVWISDGRRGFSRLTPGSGGWTVTMDRHMPDAANPFMCVAMAYSPEYGMMVRNHGREEIFAEDYLETPDIISGLKDGSWHSLSALYANVPNPLVFDIYNPSGLAIDPRNPNHVYCGSITSGLYRLNLADQAMSLRMTRSNDSGVPYDQCVAVAPVNQAWARMCAVAAPQFDDSGALWTAYYNPDKDSAELWYWPASDRLASTTSSNFRPFRRIALPGLTASSSLAVLAGTTSANRNIIVTHGGGWSRQFMILDHGGTPDNTGDDRRYVMRTLTDQDGAEFSIGSFNSMWEDKSTGRVWLMGSSGVCYFSPAQVLAGNPTVYRIKVARNDGTNLADYLLNDTYVTCMTEDTSGRKWFGTIGGGIVVTNGSGNEIARTYTTENSDLPDNNVHGIAYNPSNNSMMISTGKGLCELVLDFDGTDGDSGIRAYPNPVTPEFLGNVTIDGLPDRATVKILDYNNRMVKDLGFSSAGAYEWNLTDNNNKRVPSGIYYVLATNGPDRDSYAKVSKIMVIN